MGSFQLRRASWLVTSSRCLLRLPCTTVTSKAPGGGGVTATPEQHRGNTCIQRREFLSSGLSSSASSNDSIGVVLSKTTIRKMRVTELREQLSLRGLDTNGLRESLMMRLMDDVFGSSTNTGGVSKASDENLTKTVPLPMPLTPSSSRFSSERHYILQMGGLQRSTLANVAIGLVLYDAETSEELWTGRKYFADERFRRFSSEYMGIIIGIQFALDNGIRKLTLQTDDHVILNQMRGILTVHQPELRPLCKAAGDLIKDFTVFEMDNISRAQNEKATSLARLSLASKTSHGLSVYDTSTPPGCDDLLSQLFPSFGHSASIPSSRGLITSIDSTVGSPAAKVEVKAPKEKDPKALYLLRFDGGSRGNPGVAGAGMVIYDDNHEEFWCGWKYLTHRATNNDAEYTALLVGLKCALSMGITNLIVEGDSNLVIRQLDGRYKVKVERLAKLCKECLELLGKFETVILRHIPRAENKRADQLANMAMDTRQSFGFEDVP